MAAAAVDLSPPAPAVPSKDHIHTHSCPACGTGLDMAELADARQRIEELEAQMERLKEKATAADAPRAVDTMLLNELERERALRAKAEARVQTVDSEIEELSVQLFSQANEMVAEERRARAKLEERVETLERRDREKMGRLDRLEKAVTRVERVKALLSDHEVGKKGDMLGSGGLLLPARR
ncbi:hypothetical protein CFE70_003198 [Pyrenophora teres f. teres 0-1]